MIQTRQVPPVKPRRNQKRAIPGSIRFLAMLLCIYLAAPLYDIPLLGLSLSAPLLFLLTLEIERRTGGIRIKRLGRLPVLLALIWVAQLISLVIAQFYDLQTNMNYGLVTLLRYAYWFFVCCLSASLFLEGDSASRAVRHFAYGCQLVALFVLAEYLLRMVGLGTGRSAMGTLSQNSCGWQFSAFVPFALHQALFSTKAKLRSLFVFGAVLLAVLLNASRSSWGAVTLGLALYIVMLGLAKRNKGRTFMSLISMGIVLLLVAGSVAFLPDEMMERVLSRPVAAADIERDKSWQIRLLMIQKGNILFQESPVFGIGPGQFRYRVADLIIPVALRYESNAYFNEKSSHNSYMQLLAEGGLALAIPMVLLLFWLLISGGRAALRMTRAGEGWAIPVWVSFVCFSTHFWAVAGFTSTAPWFLYGFLGAVILRATKITRLPVR